MFYVLEHLWIYSHNHIFGVCDCVHQEAVTWEAHFNTSAINANFTAAFLSIDNCIIFHEFYFIAEWRRIDHESSIVSHGSWVFYSISSTINLWCCNDFIKTKKHHPCLRSMPDAWYWLSSGKFHCSIFQAAFLIFVCDIFRGCLLLVLKTKNPKWWLSMGEFEPLFKH